MTKHSKNTASSIVSYAEYKKLDYELNACVLIPFQCTAHESTPAQQRLGNESMRRFRRVCTLPAMHARPRGVPEGALVLQRACLDGLRCVNRLASPPDPVPYVLLRPRFARKCDGMLTLCGTIPIAVTQISDIKRQKVRLEALKKEAEEERERA